MPAPTPAPIFERDLDAMLWALRKLGAPRVSRQHLNLAYASWDKYHITFYVHPKLFAGEYSGISDGDSLDLLHSRALYS